MSLEIYKSDYSNRMGIDHPESVRTRYLYNGVGKFALVAAASNNNIEVIQKNNLVYDTETGVTYTIQSVKKDTTKNQVVAGGFTSNWLLNKRVIASTHQLTNVEKGVYDVVAANLRGLFRVAVAKPIGLAATNETELYGGQLLDGVEYVLAEVDYGNRLVWDDDTRSHTFEVYQGRDLTPEVAGKHAVVFSEAQGTARNLVAGDDDSSLKNYFYIECKNSDGTEEVVTYGDPKVADLREHWVTSTISQSKDETHDDFVARAQQRCREEAVERIRRQNFSVEIDPTELGEKYRLGDKVACVSERLGVSFEARITGVENTLDATGAKTKIELGEPTLTALGEVKL